MVGLRRMSKSELINNLFMNTGHNRNLILIHFSFFNSISIRIFTQYGYTTFQNEFRTSGVAGSNSLIWVLVVTCTVIFLVLAVGIVAGITFFVWKRKPHLIWRYESIFV